MSTFHITVYYRTRSSCNTFMVNVEAGDHTEALSKGRERFVKARPRHQKIDRIEAVAARSA